MALDIHITTVSSYLSREATKADFESTISCKIVDKTVLRALNVYFFSTYYRICHIINIVEYIFIYEESSM